jgi:hypothetical protein
LLKIAIHLSIKRAICFVSEERFLEDLPKKAGHNKLLKTVSLILVVILLFFVVVWARALYGARESYHKGEAFLKEGDTIRAITFFDRSIHWYTPLNPYVEKAALKLWAIGEEAEKAGDKRLALIAYESIRNGFYGDTHLVTPGRKWIRKVDSKLAGLRRGEAEKGKTSQPEAFSGKSPYPDPFWSVVVVIGFLGWIGSLIGLIVVTFKRGGVRTGNGIIWLGFSFLCFVLWVAGMVKA